MDSFTSEPLVLRLPTYVGVGIQVTTKPPNIEPRFPLDVSHPDIQFVRFFGAPDEVFWGWVYGDVVESSAMLWL